MSHDPAYAPAASIPGSRIRQIAALADLHPGTLRLFYGEDTLATPDFIKAAGRGAIAENFTFYTPNAGFPELREAIAAMYARLHRTETNADQIVTTASGMVAIALVCQATLSAEDSAILITPLWPNLSAAVRVTGAESIEIPLSFDESGFRLDFDRIEAAVKPNTRLLALASPGNPTGWTASHDDWERIVAFCDRHDLWLLADGVYERLVFDREIAPSPWEIADARKRTIVTQSFSKTYRMTGWRIGYTIALAETANRLKTLQEFVVSHAAGFTQRAALAALEQGESFVAESRLRYERHRRIAIDKLRKIPGIVLAEPPGSFYVFPRLDGLTDSFAFCRGLVVEHRLGVAPGSAFGAGGEGHVRLCFAVEENVLREAIDRFEVAWKDYRKTL